jgi:hypothetical protein
MRKLNRENHNKPDLPQRSLPVGSSAFLFGHFQSALRFAFSFSQIANSTKAKLTNAMRCTEKKKSAGLIVCRTNVGQCELRKIAMEFHPRLTIGRNEPRWTSTVLLPH